jgi:hypothetical protein
LIEHILEAKAVDARANVSAQECEIDEQVYALYGLWLEEIKIIVESATDGGE